MDSRGTPAGLARDALYGPATRSTQSFDVSSRFYSSVVRSPVDMRIDLAVTEYREGTSKQVTVTAGSFKVTDDGICSVGNTTYSYTTTLQCKSALNEPTFAAHMDPASTTCTLPDSTWPSLQVRRNDGNPTADIESGVGLFPVQPFEIDFGAATNPSGDKAISIVCPGTHVTIATPAPLVGIGSKQKSRVFTSQVIAVLTSDPTFRSTPDEVMVFGLRRNSQGKKSPTPTFSSRSCSS